jgi:MutS domain V
MNVFLMHRDRDFELDDDPSSSDSDLVKDLELDVLFQSMAGDDELLFRIARGAVLAGLSDPDAILYRQQILADCMEHSHVVRGIYGIAVDAIEREKRVWGWMSSKYPEETLHRSVEVLQIFAELLGKLRDSAEAQRIEFRSEGFKRLFAGLSSDLNDEYLHTVEEHLQRLKYRDGILMSAQLGQGNKGVKYILRKQPYIALSWFERFRDWVGQRDIGNRKGHFYEIDEHDEAGFRALFELRSRGIAQVAIALARSTDHILNFFRVLRLELGFYIGCLNLHDLLLEKQQTLCFPVPLPKEHVTLSARELYDVCLSLSSQDRVVSNNVTAEDKTLVVITGANRGGKTVFLRSIGLAQLMMQAGMFVPAESFRANLCASIFTHFKRGEDASMKSGKLDEELSRMSGIIDQIIPYSMVLFNESFASTNEREGSEIARQIVRALLEMRVKVLYVTHMFDLAESFYLAKMEHTLFLRAERLADGRRTFRLTAGEPLPTSFGKDLYRRIFEGTSVAGAR